MKIAHRYTWEAETSSGEIITSGRSLRDCVRISLIPQKTGLPRHDIAGAVLRQRFCRGFVRKTLGGGVTRFYFHCIETGSVRIWVDCLTGGVLVTSRNYEHYV